MGMNKLLFFFILLLITIPVFSQEQPAGQTQVIRTEEGFVLQQTITFPENPDSLRYEVEIEQMQQSRWILIHSLETETNSFSISLAAGSYRYRYMSYNKMNLLDGRSGWQTFQVQTAVNPEPLSYKPFYGMFFELPGSEAKLTVYGEGFYDRTEFALVRSRKNFDWSGVQLENIKNAIIATKVEATAGYAIVSFPRDSVKSGTYEIFVRNPGGLWVTFGQVRVGYQHNNDFIFEYAWSPALGIDDLTAAGFYFRLGWIPLKTKIGNFGIGTQFFFGENIDTFGTLNILYQYPISERMQHSARIGVMPMDFWHFNLGYSFQFFIWKNLYATAGIDLFLAHNFDNNESRFIIRPGIGIGWQLGRWADQAEVIEAARREKDYSIPVTKPPKGEHELSIGWAPMVPFAGADLHGTRYTIGGLAGAPTQGHQYITGFNPLGFNLRYAYLPYRWEKNKFGFEFELNILGHDNSDKLGDAQVLDIINSFLFGIRYQRAINSSWYINARLAVGYANAYKYTETFYDPADTPPEYNFEAGFGFNAGISVQWFFWKDMFAQMSADLLVVDAEPTRVFLRPGISVGWQFRRNSETGIRMQGHGFPVIPSKQR